VERRKALIAAYRPARAVSRNGDSGSALSRWVDIEWGHRNATRARNSG
jgi:hypothetical protein